MKRICAIDNLSMTVLSSARDPARRQRRI